MTPREQTVQRLYECLKANDAAGAAECYCEDATFHDIAFDQRGKANIANMWRFECSRGLTVTFRDIRTEGETVKGHWDCHYLFHGKNPVDNSIDSTFTFREDRILTHHDDASRWKWAKQALGPVVGGLVTVAPFILWHQANSELRQFLKDHPA